MFLQHTDALPDPAPPMVSLVDIGTLLQKACRKTFIFLYVHHYRADLYPSASTIWLSPKTLKLVQVASDTGILHSHCIFKNGLNTHFLDPILHVLSSNTVYQHYIFRRACKVEYKNVTLYAELSVKANYAGLYHLCLEISTFPEIEHTDQ